MDTRGNVREAVGLRRSGMDPICLMATLTPRPRPLIGPMPEILRPPPAPEHDHRKSPQPEEKVGWLRDGDNGELRARRDVRARTEQIANAVVGGI